jgi:hypothetical protein
MLVSGSGNRIFNFRIQSNGIFGRKPSKKACIFGNFHGFEQRY